MRILLLDDNPRDLFDVKPSIQQEFPHAKIVEIWNATHFDDQIRSGICDLVVTKQELPWISGIDVLKQVKSLDPLCPVIMFTTGGSEQVAVDAMKSGLDDYIVASPGYFVRLRMAARTAVEHANKRRQQAVVSTDRERLLMELQEANATKDEFLVRLAERTKELNRVNKELRASERELQESLGRERAAREAAEKNEHRSLVLSEASRILSSSLEVKRTLSNLVRLAAGSIGDVCTIDLVHHDGIERVDAAHADPSQQHLIEPLKNFPVLPRDSPFERIIATGRTQVGDISEESLAKYVLNEERRRSIRALGLKSYMAVPLRSRGRSIGMMTLASSSPSRYGESEISLAEQLADRAAIAFDNARLYSEVQSSNRLKDEFLATMSHELRTPLTSILGWTQMLRTPGLPEDKQRRAIAIIGRNAELEARLVEDILDASRIISGKLKLDFGPVDVAAILKYVLQSMKPSAEEKDLQILTDLPAVQRVWGSAPRLEQVFRNLLSNAIKFTPPGGRISILVRDVESRVEVRVTDTGEGIRAEFIPQMFERFRQADSSSTRKHGGLGLGLAIVRHIVELHSGTVAAESPGPGYGSTFTVSIPVSDTRSRGTVLRFAAKEVSRSALSGKKALVVEDDSDSRVLLAEILEQYGAQVDSADSYETAVKLLEHSNVEVHVVLIDIGLPERDGYSLIAKIRSILRYRYTPAVAVTAFATDDDRSMALSAGFQGYIAKPFDSRELVSQVASVITKGPPQRRSA